MSARIIKSGLQIAEPLFELVENQILPGLAIDSDQLWKELADILGEFSPRNRALLNIRHELQCKIDQWHQQRIGESIDLEEYQDFLADIGYLVQPCPDFEIDVDNVDPEISNQAGPQLVVPVNNARFAINAANARWGSLYDALYGTDAISEDEGADRTISYNPVRGQKVIEKVKSFLDDAAPLRSGQHNQATAYIVENGELSVHIGSELKTWLASPEKFVGYRGNPAKPNAILLNNHGLHIEIQFDRQHSIGSEDSAGIKDVILESALTTIQDCEDSVAAVDAEDKTLVYRNWLGLIKGDLKVELRKKKKHFSRTLNPDREFTSPDGETFTLPGRSLMLVRNVGHLMTTDAVLDQQGCEIPEGILDGLVTSLIALHDFIPDKSIRNSRKGSIYIVKPKMHGPREVTFTCDLFTRIEQALKLARNTIKLGLMDEERRTSVNLKVCIRAARERVVFINTGFLDRTGDEIHTGMEAGAFMRKAEIKSAPWITAYENQNVELGLRSGFQGRAQIGKGMWAMPDMMSAMLKDKLAHPLSGANTAWVPSPTAATLHAIHYHQINVVRQQNQVRTRPAAELKDILTIPLLDQSSMLSPVEVQRELDNNIQGILGYVVRWIDQGIGCSKVPDINNIGLMEDRATLRISSQHIANWLAHGICKHQQVMATLKRMAVIVDQQNIGDHYYQPMSEDFSSNIAFQTACDLIFKGKEQPNGYTEPLLHRRRKQKKLLASNPQNNPVGGCRQQLEAVV